MKCIIVITFLFLFVVSCTGRQCWSGGGGGVFKSTSYDKRCFKLQKEASKKGEESGVCFKIPEDSEKLWFASEVERLNPDPEACKALFDEARKKCKALGPPGPGDIVQTSGSAFFKKGKPVMIDGKPICP